MKIDMHCHTVRSDGTGSPEYVIEAAKEREIDFLCITDHDKASTDIVDMIQAAGIWTVPSVEISSQNSKNDERSMHVTHYTDMISEDIGVIIENTREQKTQLIQLQLYHLQEKGFFVDIEEFYKFAMQWWRQRAGISKYDIARYIASRKENFTKLCSLWCDNDMKLHRGFYNLCLKRSGRYYQEYGVEIEEYEPELEKLLEIVQDTWGILSIAHPNFTFARAWVRGFVQLYEEVYRPLGITAIEINTRATKKWVDAILALKDKYGDGLQITFGSDCHQIGKPDDKHGDLGFENWSVWEDIIISEMKNFRAQIGL